MTSASLLFLAAALTQAVPDTGGALYRAWCGACHGAEGRGESKLSTRLEVPAADLADCKISSAEPEDRWLAIVRDGGASVGLSMDMPAYGEHASEDDLRAIVRYTRSLCGDPRWPPGELNFPRGFLTEKAFPENEVVIETRGREQEFIYERRLGPRLQLEGVARTVFDGGDVFGGFTAAAKYNVWHSVGSGALLSAGLEVTPPVGRQALWEFEPFLAAGLMAAGLVFQAEALGIWEETGGVTAFGLRGGVARELGRAVPMLETGWTIPRAGGASSGALYPQVWIQLSRLGHVAASIGAEVPLTDRATRDDRLVAFVLWDFGDGGLTRGW